MRFYLEFSACLFGCLGYEMRICVVLLNVQRRSYRVEWFMGRRNMRNLSLWIYQYSYYLIGWSLCKQALSAYCSNAGACAQWDNETFRLLFTLIQIERNIIFLIRNYLATDTLFSLRKWRIMLKIIKTVRQISFNWWSLWSIVDDSVHALDLLPKPFIHIGLSSFIFVLLFSSG